MLLLLAITRMREPRMLLALSRLLLVETMPTMCLMNAHRLKSLGWFASVTTILLQETVSSLSQIVVYSVCHTKEAGLFMHPNNLMESPCRLACPVWQSWHSMPSLWVGVGHQTRGVA